jgi:glycosyltransferase involved in cell wall biosynthesis
MSAIRVALCADFREEQWPSMDRVANELALHVQRHHDRAVDLTPVCPPFIRRATTVSTSRRTFTIDRALNRWWDYPRHIDSIAGEYDVFHIIDHSYAHLVHRLPSARTVVTCHDLDTFRSVLRPEEERRSVPFRMGTRRILTGLQKAAAITCDSAAVRDELLSFGVVPSDRVSVAPIGVGEAFRPDADAAADGAAERLAASKEGAVEILHVGSTIARKRIDSLLAICAALVPAVPELHLIRVGGPFTPDQQRLLENLGLGNRVSVVGFVNERTLAALYRRAAVVLQPSEREGFGLPLLEAMACGTPVIASDLPVLREVGGQAVEYCRVGDVEAWTRAVKGLIDERAHSRARRLERQRQGVARARRFSWSRFAAQMAGVYQTIANLNAQVSTVGRAVKSQLSTLT